MTTHSLKYYDFADNKLKGVSTTAITSMSPEGESAISFTELHRFEHTANHKTPLSVSSSATLLSKENFEAKSMRSAIPSDDYLIKTTSQLNDDAVIPNPQSYGYVPTVQETRNNDAIDILNQEMSIMGLGSVAGVALIILGMMVMYPSSSS